MSEEKKSSDCCGPDSPKKRWMDCFREFSPKGGWGSGNPGVSSSCCDDEKNDCGSEGFVWTWMKKRFGVSKSKDNNCCG